MLADAAGGQRLVAEKPLLNRMRVMIERPDHLTNTEVSTVLIDAGETIVMLQRIVQRLVRERASAAGSSEGL